MLAIFLIRVAFASKFRAVRKRQILKMAQTGLSIRSIDDGGERWIFAIRLDRPSFVSNSRQGVVGSISLVAMRSMLVPDQSAMSGARNILDVFNLVVMATTRKNIDASALRRAASKLARAIATRERPATRTVKALAAQRHAPQHASAALNRPCA